MKIKGFVPLIYLFFFIFSCAKEGMPPGGPEDKTPPRIVFAFPSSDSIKVAPDVEVEVTFSERVERKKTEESIFVSPLPEIPWELSWHRNRLSLKPPEPLRMKTTYVITVGTDARDLRGNRMKESYSFAFSTGDFIDSCKISGEAQIQENKEAGISIWAYLLKDETEIQVFKEKPAYITQTDYEGKYNLQNLHLGKYRLFAVKDKNKDLVWDIDEEPIGVTTQDVILDSVTFAQEHINFILAQRDTIAPALVNCQALDKNTIRLDFSEKLQEESIPAVNNYLIHLQKNPEKALDVFSVYFQGDNSKSVFLVTEEMEQGENYQVLVLNLRDESGNEIDSASNSCLFRGTGLPDTIGLTILDTQPKDREINVPLKSDVKIFFSEPPVKKSLESNFIFMKENEELVKGISLWESDVVFRFIPDSLLSSMTIYKVKLKDVYDISDNPLSDSLFEISFTTLNQDTLGSVSGGVIILGNIQKENIVVVLKKIDSDEIRYEKVLKDPGNFLFDMVLPGKYLAKAFIDQDEDKKHGIGEIFPYIPVEPYTIFPDTIPVRSRWETENIMLIFK